MITETTIVEFLLGLILCGVLFSYACRSETRIQGMMQRKIHVFVTFVFSTEYHVQSISREACELPIEHCHRRNLLLQSHRELLR